MTDPVKIGEPIPLGTVTRDTAALGVDSNDNESPTSGPDDAPSVAEQMKALRAEIDALTDRVSQLGRAAGDTVQAHPMITATVVSLSAVAFLYMFYRRSAEEAWSGYPAIRNGIDRWR